MQRYTLFVTCSLGLEGILLRELTELGIHQPIASYCGVEVPEATMNDVYRINYSSRIASRVLIQLKTFRCRNQRDLYQNTFDIDWYPFIKPRKTMAIDANVTSRELRNSLFAAQVMKDAICDQLREQTGDRPSIDTKEPDVQLNLFIHGERGVISFDSSGVPLHKRGYRVESTEAPLQECLAAAILRIANYSDQEVLYDPCCGSGTFLIEAAMMATQTPPGFLRNKWGFFRFPHYNQQDWIKVRAEVDSLRRPLAPNIIFGTDVNKNSYRVSKINLRAAGFHQAVQVVHSDFREYTPTIPPTLVVTNPPHGTRLDSVDQLIPLYRSLGDFLKRETARPAKGFIFSGSLELSKEVGLKATQRHVLYNGGIESRLLEYDLY